MTSLSEAFGSSTAQGWAAGGDGASRPEPRYEEKMQARYQDTGIEEEAERRYAYEQSRQKLYAKAQTPGNMRFPTMKSQESFETLLPAGQGGSVHKAALSCMHCHADMTCSSDDYFCRNCNESCLRGGSGGR